MQMPSYTTFEKIGFDTSMFLTSNEWLSRLQRILIDFIAYIFAGMICMMNYSHILSKDCLLFS